MAQLPYTGESANSGKYSVWVVDLLIGLLQEFCEWLVTTDRVESGIEPEVRRSIETEAVVSSPLRAEVKSAPEIMSHGAGPSRRGVELPFFDAEDGAVVNEVLSWAEASVIRRKGMQPGPEYNPGPVYDGQGKEVGDFYAVARGFRPGIYWTWRECAEQTYKYRHPLFKRFNTLREAVEFMNGRYLP
jgi:hypothetical protein